MARRMGALRGVLRGLHKVHCLELHFIAMRSIALHVVQMLVPVTCKQMGHILPRCR
jgi:hypothetical protein